MKSIMKQLAEIKERTLFVTDSVDGRVEAFLELDDYEWLINTINKFEEAVESKHTCCDQCNSGIRKVLSGKV